MAKNHYAGSDIQAWSWAWIRLRAGRHIWDMLKLSPPIIASRLAGYLLVVVDTMMVLRYSVTQNQWLAVGAGTSSIFLGATIGFTIGVPILISRLYGAKNYGAIGDVWRHGILWSIITGGVITLLCILLAKPIMQLSNGNLSDQAYPIVVIYALSFIPNMIWMVGSGMLEGVKRPVPVFALSIIGNLLNILLNWIWIYGIWFFPEMGAYGSALASLSIRIFMAIITVLYILNMKGALQFNLKSWNIQPFKKWAELRMQGYSSAVSIFFEMGGWSLFTLFAARPPLTETDTAAWVININILAALFMIALGLSAATGVRVSIARGRKDFDDQIFAVIIGVLLTIFTLFIAGICAVIWAKPLASIFSQDIHIIAFAASFTIYLLWVFIPDCAQIVLSQSLRTSDIIWPTTIVASLIYGIFTPVLAFILVFTFQHGIKGMFEAIIYGSWLITFAYLALFAFYYHRIKRITLAEVMTNS